MIGTHKIQRVPKSEKNGRRHTSEVVVAELDNVKIDSSVLDSDITYTTYRGSGSGGQKRNKTDSCVRMVHVPTGLIAIAEDSVSQSANRKTAKNRLQILLTELAHAQSAEEQNQTRREAFDKTQAGIWKWTGWRDSVTAPNGKKASMDRSLRRGIPMKLLS